MKMILDILTKIKPEYDFMQSKDFIKDGYLDSYDIVALVCALEENFAIVIDPFDILPENFCSVEAITGLIKKNGGQVE